MNKKQLVCMWAGIIVFVLIIGLDPPGSFEYALRHIERLASTVIVTSGLICTFRDKQGKKDKS